MSKIEPPPNYSPYPEQPPAYPAQQHFYASDPLPPPWNSSDPESPKPTWNSTNPGSSPPAWNSSNPGTYPPAWNSSNPGTSPTYPPSSNVSSATSQNVFIVASAETRRRFEPNQGCCSCRGCCRCCTDKSSRIQCCCIFAWIFFICTIIVIPIVGALVVGPYSKVTGFETTQCTVTSSVLGTAISTCSCGNRCYYTCTVGCLRVQVTYRIPSTRLSVTTRLNRNEVSLDSECYSSYLSPSSSPFSCWYNPDNNQQVIESKTLQLSDAVNSLLWPLLVCVLSFACIVYSLVFICRNRNLNRPVYVIT